MTKQVPAKSTKSRRRKSARAKPTVRAPTPDETFYEIRGIIDEKYVGGKLLYKVDWVDNPTTGERYDPTWVCSVLVPLSFRPTLRPYLAFANHTIALLPGTCCERD